MTGENWIIIMICAVKEIEYLKMTCQPKLTIRKVEAVDHTLVVETKVTAQEIQGIVISGDAVKKAPVRRGQKNGEKTWTSCME